MPIIILSLFLLEYNGARALVILVIGIAFLIGRWTHAQGLMHDNLRKQVRGMGATLTILIGLGLANIVLAGLKIMQSF